jgi:hypothetical protein
VNLYERLTTLPGGKITPAHRVETEKAPLRVTRHLFEGTKLRSSCLDWEFLRLNSGESNSVNRP